jgi:prevent-host-death family protein
MTVTEAARTFSKVLARVAAGDEVAIMRNGVAVAVVSPPSSTLTSADRFRSLMASAPRPDDTFLDDLRTRAVSTLAESAQLR